MDAARLTRMTHKRADADEGRTPGKGITLESATDVLWTYNPPELMRTAGSTGGAGQSHGRDNSSADSMIAALLP